MDDKVIIPWDRVAALLESAGRRQTWLAKQLNVSSNVVSNWKGRGGVPSSRAQSIARVFGVSVDVVMEGCPDPVQLSKAGVRLVQRIGEMDREGLLTRQAEAALMAFIDLVEGVGASATYTKGRK